MASGIYAIINIVNDRHYVGQAKILSKRFREHLNALKGGYHFSIFLQRAWFKHGVENFIFVKLESCSLDKLNEREQYWINVLKPDYNSAPTAGSMRGYKHTDEARANMAKAQFGKKQSDELKEKRKIWMKGNKHAAGVKQSAERIEARASVIRGKPKSAETKAKMSAAQKGRVFSEETKRKMSEAAKRRCARLDKSANV